MNLSQDILTKQLTHCTPADSTFADTSPERKTLTGGSINSANQFNMNTYKENAELKKEVQMLRQQNEALQQQEIRLQEKLELKANELMQVKAELGATNILQKQLREKEDENCKLKQELHDIKKGSPINPHKQCEALQLQLQQQLKKAGDLIITLRIQRDELAASLGRKIGEVMEQHMNNVNISESSRPSNNKHSQDDSAQPQVQTDNEDEQNLSTLSKEQNNDDIPTIGIDCQFNSNNPADRVASERSKSRQQLDDALSDFRLLQTPTNIAISTQRSEGYLQWNSKGELVNITAEKQEQNIAKFRTAEERYRCKDCKIIWSSLRGWQSHSTLKGCSICDVFIKAIYIKSIGSGMPTRQPKKRTMQTKDEKEILKHIKASYNNLFNDDILGKRKSQSISLDRAAVRQAKMDNGQQLTLDERRCEEAQDIKPILKEYEKDMLQIQDYLNHFKEMQSKNPFEKIDRIFCDGIIIPRLEQLFSTYKDFEAAFHSAGIQVQKISPAQKEGFVYVRLMDSANTFTVEFIMKLNTFIQNLRKKLEAKKEKQEIFDSCFVQQIDCTQDVKGFFLSFDVKADIRELSKLMKMNITRDYPTFESLFTLLNKHNYGTEECPLLLKQLRFKIYNKLLHFLESEQGKKKISMNLKALLNCSSQFYQKLLRCGDNGVSRLEFSHYFYSFEESQQIEVKQYQQELDNAFQQINKLPQIRYRVPFKLFFDCFWSSSKPMFIFQKDSWTVIYAKHSKSAYVGQIVKITNNRFKNNEKIDVIKRFAIPGRWCTAVDNVSGRVFKVMKKGKSLMQIPIQSLNTVHLKSYDFDFDSEVFKYHLHVQELSEIQLVLQSGEKFEFPADVSMSTLGKKKREKKQNTKGCENKERIDVTLDVNTKHTKSGNILTVNRNDQSQCMFKAQKGQSKVYVKYVCSKQPCDFVIEKIYGVYYLQ